jgi:amino acid transporter
MERSSSGSPSQPARSLSLFDCICIGTNGIIGSGIFLLMAPLAKLAGYASVLGVLSCGMICLLIALCFAELCGIFARSGGPYVYAQAAFGRQAGFCVGWMSMAAGVLGFSAVAVGFAEALSRVLPVLSFQLLRIGGFAATSKTLVAVLLVVGMGAINYFGVKAGARTSDALSMAKLVPLIALALVGLLWVKPEVLTGMFSTASIPAAPEGSPSYLRAISSSAFLAVFMLSGFEYTSVPAGEARDAQRNVPLAIVGSLAGATVLYCLLQLVALSALPALHESEQPLIEAAGHVFGTAGSPVFAAASLVSMAGFCASSALVGPRYFTAMAADGYLPVRLIALNRFKTPGAAIALSSGLAALLALFLSYGSLVDISNVALFAQYIPTCLAALVLRYRMPDAHRVYRLPAGPLIPIAGAGFSIALLAIGRPNLEEWIFSAELLILGLLIWGGRALLRRPAVAPAP